MEKTLKKLKIGFDVHGVLDDQPEFFSYLTFLIECRGGEVHILTGHRDNEEQRQELIKLHIHYTHLFSITSYHESIGTPIKYQDEKHNHPIIDDILWNRSKGDYAERHGLDFHIDNCLVYQPYFKTTKFVYYQSKNSNRKWTCTKCDWNGRYSKAEHVMYKGIDWEHCPVCHSIAIPI